MKNLPRLDSNPKCQHERRECLALSHNHMLEEGEYFIMVINKNDSRTFRPAAIMIVGKAEINASGSFWISRQY